MYSKKAHALFHSGLEKMIENGLSLTQYYNSTTFFEMFFAFIALKCFHSKYLINDQYKQLNICCLEFVVKCRNLRQVQKFASSIEICIKYRISVYWIIEYSILYTNIQSTEILYPMQISVVDDKI